MIGKPRGRNIKSGYDKWLGLACVLRFGMRIKKTKQRLISLSGTISANLRHVNKKYSDRLNKYETDSCVWRKHGNYKYYSGIIE